MSSHEAIIRYDGPALVDHKMDVEDIAPALLALGELCKRANSIANGDHAGVQLKIKLDVEQRCAQIGLEIVQTFLDKAQAFLDDRHTATAQQLFVWLGIVAGGPMMGFLTVLTMLRGRKPDSVNIVIINGQHVTQINAGGEVFTAYPIVADLIRDPAAVRKAKEVVRPVTRDGYESVEFLEHGRVTQRIVKEEAILIEALPPAIAAKQVETIIPESFVEATVKIRRATYEGPGKWTIQYDKSREVGFDGEAMQWLTEFQADRAKAPPGTLLHVKMRLSEIRVDKAGDPIEEPTYTIVQVLRVVPPPKQHGMFD